ncbi:MAG: HlyD family secretion protein [Acidobacteria bacterium]|nr:HlyD family secretion protein [Acidobacteriota bacterium]MBI3657036.1 HlyD family secretion protein [Acidobacteriota bacterium]
MKATMRNSILLLPMAVIGLAVTLFMMGRNPSSPPDSAAALTPHSESVVAAAGRVEPISEEIKVGSEISGRINSLTVDEGDAVQRGLTLAVLENRDYQAQVASAEAQLLEKEAEYRRIRNGARARERGEVWEAVNEIAATAENARVEMERRQTLYRKGVIAREEVNRAERDYQVAKARYAAATHRHELINDEAREEDIARAQADVALARARLQEARARRDKTIIRSPIDGVVLRKHLKVGESVSNAADMPIFTVADTSKLCARADVDESDIDKIRLGQSAYVTADAFGDRRFSGRVVRIGQALGKKNVRTDKPTERLDTKILETLIELDDGHELPIGLRVDAFIAVASSVTPAVRSK